MKQADWKDSFRRRIRKKKVGNRPHVENGSISYVKKPFAARSRLSLVCAVLGLALALISIGISIASRGEGGLNIAAFGLSSILFSAAAFFYGLLSFAEKDRNYLLARIGIGVGGILLVFWISMVAVGVLV